MSDRMPSRPEHPADTPQPSNVIASLLRSARQLFLPPANFKRLNRQFDRLLENVGLVPRRIADANRGATDDVRSQAVSKRLASHFEAHFDVDVDDEADNPEGRILVLTGETGAGKTRAIKRVFRQRSELLEEISVSIVAPSPCTLMQLGRKLLPELGYPIQRDRKEHLIWEDVRRRIDRQGIRVLHFDEMQHVIQTANTDQQERILNTIKSLIQDRHRPTMLVLSGTCELADFLRTDGQVRRRCRFVEFERLTVPGDADVIADSLESLSEAAALRIASSTVDELAPRLIHAADYALGVAMEIACDAIEEALIEGSDELLADHFAEVYRSRSGCFDSSNPFLVHNWQDTDPKQVLDRPRMSKELLPRFLRPSKQSHSGVSKRGTGK